MAEMYSKMYLQSRGVMEQIVTCKEEDLPETLAYLKET